MDSYGAHKYKHAHNTCTQALTHTYTLNSVIHSWKKQTVPYFFLYSGIESLVVSFLVVATQTYLTNTLELRPSSFNRSPRHVNDLTRLLACCGFLGPDKMKTKIIKKKKKIKRMPKIIDYLLIIWEFVCYQF